MSFIEFQEGRRPDPELAPVHSKYIWVCLKCHRTWESASPLGGSCPACRIGEVWSVSEILAEWKKGEPYAG